MSDSKLANFPPDLSEYKSLFRTSLQTRQTHEKIFNLNAEIMTVMNRDLVHDYNSFVDSYINYYKNCVYYLARFEGFYTCLPALLSNVNRTADFMIQLKAAGVYLKDLPNLSSHLENLQKSGSNLRTKILKLCADFNVKPDELAEALKPMEEELEVNQQKLTIEKERKLDELSAKAALKTKINTLAEQDNFKRIQVQECQNRLTKAQEKLDSVRQQPAATMYRFSSTGFSGSLYVESVEMREREEKKWMRVVEEERTALLNWQKELETPRIMNENIFDIRIQMCDEKIKNLEEKVARAKAAIQKGREEFICATFSRIGMNDKTTKGFAQICTSIDEMILKMANITGQLSGAKESILIAISENRMLPTICLSSLAVALKIPIIYQLLSTGECDAIDDNVYIRNVRGFNNLRMTFVEKVPEEKKTTFIQAQAKLTEFSFEEVSFDMEF